MSFSTDFNLGVDCVQAPKAGGIWLSVFARLQRAKYTKIKSKGFFSREEWDFPPETDEWMNEFGFLAGAYSFNLIDPKSALAGYSYFNGDFHKGEAGKDFYCLDYSPAETVNAHQWHGWNPIVFEDRQSGARRTEPAQWEIASVDRFSGERKILFRSHNNRDDIFLLQSAWNKALLIVQETCAPYRDFCRENFINKRWTISHLSEGEELKTGIELHNIAVRRMVSEGYPVRFNEDLVEIES